uniref:Protein kinase domain-containing protein n=1 Tax=Nicotiana tabacum TaxID=4097 RepID=A0A1S4C454_TOBAC|nr:PREDICTED: uncharacterized protein LOC107814925 [Nicotiana tabacum]
MHHDCTPPIFHRDVKSNNILLDSEFKAKIAEFGLDKLLDKKEELHTMSDVPGSFGYIVLDMLSLSLLSFGKIVEFGLAKLFDKKDELHTMSIVAGSFGYIAPIVALVAIIAPYLALVLVEVNMSKMVCLNGNNYIIGRNNIVRDDLLFTYDENVINLVFHETSWIVDSGAILHVTPRKNFFSSYTPVNSGVLKMGNASEVKVFGVGTVCLKTNNSSMLVLQDVKHAPDFPFNLISAGRLNDEGYHNALFNGQWKPTKGSLVVAR